MCRSHPMLGAPQGCSILASAVPVIFVDISHDNHSAVGSIGLHRYRGPMGPNTVGVMFSHVFFGSSSTHQSCTISQRFSGNTARGIWLETKRDSLWALGRNRNKRWLLELYGPVPLAQYIIVCKWQCVKTLYPW